MLRGKSAIISNSELLYTAVLKMIEIYGRNQFKYLKMISCNIYWLQKKFIVKIQGHFKVFLYSGLFSILE